MLIDDFSGWFWTDLFTIFCLDYIVFAEWDHKNHFFEWLVRSMLFLDSLFSLNFLDELHNYFFAEREVQHEEFSYRSNS